MQQTQPYVRLVWRDASDTLGYTRHWVRLGVSVVDVNAATVPFRFALAAASEAAQVGQDIIYPAFDPLPGEPTGSTPVNMAAVFVFGTDTPGQYGMVWLPATRPALALATGPTAGLEIDRTLGVVEDFIAELTSGAYANPFGYPLTTCEAAFYAVRP